MATALREVTPPALSDDAPLAPLLDAVEREIDLLSRSQRPLELRFGATSIPRDVYVQSLRHFVELGRAARDTADFLAAVGRDYRFYRASIGDSTLVTSYYEPIIRGSRTPTEHYSRPLYRRPPDLRAPYYTREEIDSKNKLAGRGLELCWVDPIDAFVLQTEGSGTVRFDDGSTLALDYAGTNGRPHERLSRFLKDVIPAKAMSMQSIEAYLRGLPIERMQSVLDRNPHYVFFQERAGSGPATSLGVAPTDGRTIATDARYFPKGALAYLVTTRPVFDDASAQAPSAWAPLARFVLDQDTGSGIKGARVDLFWGSGEDAARFAGVMKQKGQVYYLVPR